MDLENSFCGTIEERDEMEEPEMQDISFKELGSEERNWEFRERDNRENILTGDTDNLLPPNVVSRSILEEIDLMSPTNRILEEEDGIGDEGGSSYNSGNAGGDLEDVEKMDHQKFVSTPAEEETFTASTLTQTQGSFGLPKIEEK